MNKVGYISYHNDGNTLQLDNVLNSKENCHLLKTGIYRFIRGAFDILTRFLCCHAELKD